MGKTLERDSLETMLLMWGMVQKHRQIGGRDCAPSSSDLKAIRESGAGRSNAKSDCISDVLLVAAEVDGWINKQPHVIRELFYQEYVVGVEEVPSTKTFDAGGQTIEAPVIDADGDQVYTIRKTFSIHRFNINLECLDLTASKLGKTSGQILAWAYRSYKKRLAQEKNWEL